MPEIKLLSIIVPVFNEQENIQEFYNQLKQELQTLLYKYEHEIIFINDGSTDDSMVKLKDIANSDKSVKIVEFTRNFGKEVATTAGIKACQGRACIIMDADLQHPIRYIHEFLTKWDKGAEVVIGVRSKDKSNGLFRDICSFLFYKIINNISNTPIMSRATDYRLLDRVVIDEFNKFTERNRISRGLIDWLGFKRDYIYFRADKRKNGSVSYSYIKLVKLAMNTFVSHSLLPLKLAGYLGIFITFVSGLLGTFIFIEKYLLKDPWSLSFSGPAILAVILLFLIGIVLICLGLIALYIGNIHGEVINRPLYVIRNKVNFNE